MKNKLKALISWFATNNHKAQVIIVLVVMLALIMIYCNSAHAGGKHHNTIYYITEVTEVTEITEVTDVTNHKFTSSLSDSDVSDIINGAIAGGSHQFDYSTTRWQVSVTGSFDASDWDGENGVSFAIGKRFGKDAWIPNALFHAGYTPINGDDYFQVGGTIVLDD